MKLIIEIDEDVYLLCKSLPQGYLDSVIGNGTPYNPSGDCISREELKKHKVRSEERHEYVVPVYNIDNAPTVPLPNEQIAWEQGYEAGLAQGKHDRQEGEWLEYNATGKKQYMCSECGMEEKNPKIARYCYWCGAKMKGGEDNEKSN